MKVQVVLRCVLFTTPFADVFFVFMHCFNVSISIAAVIENFFTNMTIPFGSLSSFRNGLLFCLDERVSFIVYVAKVRAPDMFCL